MTTNQPLTYTRTDGSEGIAYVPVVYRLRAGDSVNTETGAVTRHGSRPVGYMTERTMRNRGMK